MWHGTSWWIVLVGPPRGLGTGSRVVELKGRLVCVHTVASRRREVSSVTARKE